MNRFIQCTHAWPAWSDWEYYGNGEDIRRRDCKRITCGEFEEQTRPHQHSFPSRGKACACGEPRS